MKVRQAWRAGLKLSKAENLQLWNAMRKASRRGQHKLANRFHAIILVGQQRLTQPSAAKVLCVSTSTVTRCVMAYQKSGILGLLPRTHRGAKSRLTEEQLSRLRRMIIAGPESCGYDTGVWDGALVQDLVRARFKVTYSVSHVRAILHRLKLSVKKPKQLLSESSEALKRKWLRKELPAIKLAAKADNGVVAMEDEAGFKRAGTVHATWGPEGEDVEVKSQPGRVNCRVFGMTTLDASAPEFSFRFESEYFNGETFIRFLEQVTDRYSGRGQKLHMILDGAPCHSPAKKWAADHSSQISLHFLPPYSPELNAQEQVWRITKKSATHNRFFPTEKLLHDALKRRFNRYQGNPAALKGVVAPFVCRA